MARRRVRLNSAGAVMTEMSAIYRLARDNRMPWPDAWFAVKILEKLRLAIENTEYEQALRTLEADRGIKSSGMPLSGHGHGATVHPGYPRPS